MGDAKLWRSIFLIAPILILGLANLGSAAYPDRAVHLIVGTGPGGGSDFLARLLAQKLSDKWGKPVIVENREGASQTLADDMVAHASADGYTLGLVSNPHTISPGLMKINYDPIRDFAPITMLVTEPNILVVNPAHLQVDSVRALIDLAKSKPGQLNFGSTGPGGLSFIEMAILMNRAGIKMVNITYKGGSAAVLVALLGGEVQAMFASVAALEGQLKAGTLKALAVAGASRMKAMPDLPTVAEAANLPGYNESVFFGVVAPAKTPKGIVAKLHDDIVGVLGLPDVRQALAKHGDDVIGSTPEEFASFMAKDISAVADALKTMDVKN